MVIQTRPLAEITQEAMKVLFETLGIVNTVRFINQFTTGYGNYTAEREALFSDITLDQAISEIKQSRNKPDKFEEADQG